MPLEDNKSFITKYFHSVNYKLLFLKQSDLSKIELNKNPFISIYIKTFNKFTKNKLYSCFIKNKIIQNDKNKLHHPLSESLTILNSETDISNLLYDNFNDLIIENKAVNLFDETSMLCLCNGFNKIYNIKIPECIFYNIKKNNFTNSDAIIFKHQKNNSLNLNVFFDRIRNLIIDDVPNCSKELLIEYNYLDNNYIYFPVYPSKFIDIKELFKLNNNKLTLNVSLILIKHCGYYCPFFFLNRIN